MEFTTSRWLTVGSSSRCVVAGMLTGLSDIVDYIARDHDSDLFYLKGYQRLTRPGKQFLVKSAMISRVAEAFQTLLMEDSRVAKVYPALWAAAAEEMKWLVDLDADVWSMLGETCGMVGSDLASKCIAGGHTSFHFLWRRVLRPASQLPWSLCRGNVAENIRGLADAPCPEEPVSKQLWQLLSMGYSARKVEMTIGLLGEIPWTTLVAEQQHGSLAQFKRHHPEYGPLTLVTRAFVMQLSRLLPGPSQDEKRLATLVRRLGKIDASNPAKASGRHQMVKSLVAIAKGKKAAGQENYQMPTKALTKWCFTRHAIVWSQLSMRNQMRWNRIASATAGERQLALEREREGLRAEIDLLLSRMEEDASVPPISMSVAALSEDQVEAISNLMNEPNFRTAKKIKSAREALVEAPAPWGTETLQRLAQFEGQVRHMKDPEQPPWASIVCDHRDFLEGCALVMRYGDGSSAAFKVNYLVKNPVYVASTPLEEVPVLDSPRGQGETIWELMRQRVGRRFKCNYARMATAADVPEVSLSQIWVLPQLRHEGGVFVSSSCDELPLQVLVRGEKLTEPEEESAPKKAKVKDEHYEKALEEFPWLQFLDLKVGFNAPAGGSSSGGDTPCLPISEDAEANEEDLFNALTELEKARSALRDESGRDNVIDFGSTIRGGARHYAATGSSVHATLAVARTELAADWCRERRLALSFQAAHSVYGADVAKVLCRSWSHRMQFFFDMELAASDPGQLFAEGHIAEYEEPTELTALLASPVSGRVRERVAKIRRIPLE